MQKVKLLPTRKRHKELIKMFGDTWVVLKHSKSVQALNNVEGWMCAPIMEPNNKEVSRWLTREQINFQ